MSVCDTLKAQNFQLSKRRQYCFTNMAGQVARDDMLYNQNGIMENNILEATKEERLAAAKRHKKLRNMKIRKGSSFGSDPRLVKLLKINL